MQIIGWHKNISRTHTHIYTGDSFLLQVKRPIRLQWLMFAYIFAGSTTVIDHLFCLDNLCVCRGGDKKGNKRVDGKEAP